MARVPKILLLLRLTVVISDENRISTSPVKEKVGYLAVRGDDPHPPDVVYAGRSLARRSALLRPEALQ